MVAINRTLVLSLVIHLNWPWPVGIGLGDYCHLSLMYRHTRLQCRSSLA